MRRIERVVLHVDMDAFYAAVEIREDPRLAGRPLIVGHRGRRGVVSTCSYEARRFGVHSAMPAVTAERLCPGAVWLPGRMGLYREVSRAIRAIFDGFCPLVEPLSIDEAFLDLTGIAADLEQAAAVAGSIKRRIRAEQRLSASVGVAPNKFLAKVASDLDKPDGLTLLGPDNLHERFWPLPVERLWGVGPRTAERLRQVGIRTVRDVLRVEQEALAGLIGRSGAIHLRQLARGLDDRPVTPDRDAKSISEERTYAADLVDPDEIDRALLARSEAVARHLRRDGLMARTVHLKVRTGEFETWTRSTTLASRTDLAEPILSAARELFRRRIRLEGQGVRLLGVGVSGLERSDAGQAALFEDPDETRSRRLARAADAVRERLGEGAVTRARLLDRRRRDGSDTAADPNEASSPPSVD